MALLPLQPDDPDAVGPYLLTGRLGTGTAGAVYLGHDDDGEPVAVRVAGEQAAAGPDFRDRLHERVAALRAVDGACLSRMVDADPAASVPWLAFEFAEGPTLAEVVEQQGPLPPAALLGLAVGLAGALGAIHAAGISHYDITPASVVVGPAGPQLVDLAVEVLAGNGARVRACPGAGQSGRPADEAGPAMDVRGWGETIAFAATGQLPAAARAAPAPQRVRTGLPEVVAPAVAAALADDPADRPDARGLLELLLPGSARPRDETERYAAATAAVRRCWPHAPELHPPPGSAGLLAQTRIRLLIAVAALIGVVALLLGLVVR